MTELFEERLRAKPTASSTVLAVMSGLGQEQVPVSALIASGEVFGFSRVAIRVAITRLVKGGVLGSDRRGHYFIAPQGQGVYQETRGWVDLPKRTKPWSGSWIAAQVGHLGRVDRTKLAIRERALRLVGMRELVRGLWVRPDNLSEQFEHTTARLRQLGLDPSAISFRIMADAEITDVAINLYDREAMVSSYHAAIAAIQNSRNEIVPLSLKDRARETLQLGSAVIGLLTYDPLLPKELIDIQAREALFGSMVEYDQIGKNAWFDYFEAIQIRGLPVRHRS